MIVVWNFINTYPFLVTIICAEFIFVIVRSHEIIIVFKSKHQRNKKENKYVERGLLRTLVLELLLFVPVSAILVIFCFSSIKLKGEGLRTYKISIYAILGIISYKFPLLTVQERIRQAALRILKEFVFIIDDPKKEDGHDSEEN